MWELDYKESWAPKNWCFKNELWCWRRLFRVTLGLQGDPTSPSYRKSVLNIHSLEELMLKLKLQYFGHLMQRTDSLKRPWWWERLKTGGEGDDRGWDGWMASPTQWTWVWVNSRIWWWTGRLGVLPSMWLQSVRHDWVSELKWTEVSIDHLNQVTVVHA